MSNSYNFNRAQRRVAKRLGLSQDMTKIHGARLDPKDRIPVFSPSLALLLCSVHRQKITDGVISDDGKLGVGFASNKVVEDAIEAWQRVVDSFEENEMPYHELLHRYLLLISGQGNCSMIAMLESDYGERVPQSNMRSSAA